MFLAGDVSAAIAKFAKYGNLTIEEARSLAKSRIAEPAASQAPAAVGR